MLQNQNPVRRWKQWLVLPALGGLFFLGSHVAFAQPVPIGKPALSEEAKKARHEELSRKLLAALHQDSLRTGGKFEPGTKQQFTIANMSKPGEIIITVTRVKEYEPGGIVQGDNSQPGRPAPPAPPAPPQLAAAAPADGSAHVYTYVEQMPQLPGGGNVAAIMQAIQSKLVYPRGATTAGRVFATFTVEADGSVSNPRIVKGLTSEFDNAVLAAIQQLPRFEPGKQAGQAVAVSYTIPIKFEPKP